MLVNCIRACVCIDLYTYTLSVNAPVYTHCGCIQGQALVSPAQLLAGQQHNTWSLGFPPFH